MAGRKSSWVRRPAPLHRFLQTSRHTDGFHVPPGVGAGWPASVFVLVEPARSEKNCLFRTPGASIREREIVRRSDIGGPPFTSDYRASGVLLHLTSLPSSFGIGDLGPVAVAWVERLAQAGQSWWQALPLGPTTYGNSPYQPLSSFAANPLLVSPDWLVEDGLLKPDETAHKPFATAAVDYGAVIPFKTRLLERAWENF